MTTREKVFVALGSNLGARDEHLAFARRRLAALPATELKAASAVEETAPLGPPDQGAYLNQMLMLETELSPGEFLDRCLAIERERGRVRGDRWGARTLDIDIVRFGERTMNTPTLTIPHPEIPNRDFWQRELAELEAYDD
jgi:2-amino-4-hydroxy-6-hydroxymethyldihydropteridine diphosphokinase